MKQCNATGEITWPNIVVVQEISPKTVRRHPTQAVKAVSIAAVILKMIRNAHLKRVRKGDRAVTAEAVNLITPDLI
jgi:predicted transcriptional regulator